MSKSNRGYRSLAYLAVLSILSLTYFSCKKDSGFGTNVLPPGTILASNFIDTSTVISSLKLKDSALSSGVTQLMLGSYNDPLFGPTKASIYTHVVLPGNSIDFQFNTYANSAVPTSVLLDSVVLVLPFGAAPGYYGTLGPQTFTVDTIQRLNNIGLTVGHAYYSDTNILHSNSHIGVATLTPNPADSFHSVYGSTNIATYPPGVRIKLNKSFGEWLIKQDSIQSSYSAYFTSGLNFINLLAGLYISVSDPIQLPGQGGIMYINSTAPGAGITFYYRISDGDTVAPQTFQLGCCGFAYFNHFDHDYTKTPFYVSGKDSVVAPKIAYIQSMGGVKTQLSFPFLSNWKKLYPIAVNKAEVEIPVNVSLTGTDIPPPQAYLVRDSAGAQSAIIDQTDGLSYYNGTYDATNHVYTFDIDRYIQAVLDGKIVDRGLYLISGNDAITANGAAIYGAAKLPNTPRIRLKMYYTRLKH